MKRRIERKLDAYRDGALYGRARTRLERRISSDPEAERRVRETDLLGQAVRSAWSEGPHAPAPEYLIAALRPELKKVDVELESGRLGPKLVAWLRSLARPVPVVALAGACAVALFVLLPLDLRETAMAKRIAKFRLDDPAPATQIYDLAQGESPLMILKGQDGSAVIWILDQPDQLSSLGGDGWA